MTDWTRRLLEFAHYISGWSKDPSTKVGAVITDQQHRILGAGYNGFPRGVNDAPERYEHRPTKYSMVVHAEANAILNAMVAAKNLQDSELYCTHAPCGECAKLIIQAGIRYVYYPESDLMGWSDSQETARLMFREAGVHFEKVKAEE